MGGPYRKSRRFGEETQFLPLARFETRTVYHIAYATPAPINTIIYFPQYDAHFLFHNFLSSLFYSKYYFLVHIFFFRYTAVLLPVDFITRYDQNRGKTPNTEAGM